MENMEFRNGTFCNKIPLFKVQDRETWEKTEGIMWESVGSQLEMWSLIPVSHDPDTGFPMIWNQDFPRSGAGSAWTFPLVGFPVYPVFPSGQDGGNALGGPEWDWPYPRFPGVLCSDFYNLLMENRIGGKPAPIFFLWE